MDSIAKGFMEIYKECPEKLAIWEETGSFTYGELFTFSFKVLGKLRRLGIKKGDFVTIELERGREYIGVMAGVWFAGAVYAALDGAYPADRLDYIAGDCNAKLRIDKSFLENIESEEPVTDIADSDPEDASLLIYTSGSTGSPKGVLHTRISIYSSALRVLIANRDYVTGDDRYALSTPFTFVAATQIIMGYMLRKTPIYLTPNPARRDPVKLSDFIAEHKITHTFISPKMLKLFRQKGNSLKIVSTGSERISGIYSSEYQVVAGYGSSESASGVLYFYIDRPYDNTPVGAPVGDEKVYILDESGSEADEGEICLAGHFAKEYLGLPEQSAAAFTKNPFKDRDGFENLLHTGDIGKRLEDGNILYINRKDWMVKINGQRVEPGEIELAVKGVDGVFDAAVRDFTNKYSQIYLAAYYVADESVSENDIRNAVENKLPSYMMPAFFVRLPKLPVNNNGKLDRKALPEPDADAFAEDYTAPENDSQSAVCGIVKEILGIGRVGIKDDFFRLGGDSIKAVMLAEKLSGYGISVADIYSAKTPEGIAALFGKNKPVPVIKHVEKPAGTKFPLTPSEQGMFLEQTFDPESTEYNLSFAIFINGAELEQVKDALVTVFKSHEAFHSTYDDSDGEPMRIITDSIPEIEIGRAAGRREIEAMAKDAGAPFDLRAAIPVRAAIYEMAGGGVGLLLVIHHIAFDGASIGILKTELLEILSGKSITPDVIDLSDIAGIDRTGQDKTLWGWDIMTPYSQTVFQ